MTRFLAKPGGETKSQLSVCKTIILIAQCSQNGQECNLEVSGYHEKTQGPLTSDLTFSASAGQPDDLEDYLTSPILYVLLHKMGLCPMQQPHEL